MNMTQQPSKVPLEEEIAEHDALSPSRVVVALDASRNSLTALHAAAQLAALMEAELHGLYVEDIELVRLSSLPFSYELGSYSATRRRLDSRAMERDFRLMAQRMRHAVAQTAISARVQWSFQVTRGSVAGELLAAGANADVLTLGRVGRTPGRQIGSTTRRVLRQALRPVFVLGREGLTFPLTLLHTGSVASERALELATLLMLGHDQPLQLIVLTDPAHDEAERAHRARRCVERLESQDLAVDLYELAEVDHFLALQETIKPGALILPSELAALLEALDRSAILVP
jgi:nucleotide-binding universal stress UspA family protein